MKPLKLIALSLCFASATLSMAQNPANYRPAVYPQQQTTAGTARLERETVAEGTKYTLVNDLFAASFVEKDGVLRFDGCSQMDLLPGTELFTVKLGTNGAKVVNASEMTLKDVQMVSLAADAKAVKGHEHFDGQALVATYSYKYGTSTLTLVWTAELRDGSHYLKTNVQLSADKDTKMFAVVPMQYSLDVAAAGSRPVAVGDNRLRGRVLANDKVFAMLDTPTGINTVGDDEGSTINPEDIVKTWAETWKPSDFSVIPQSEIPHRVIEQGYNNPNVLVKECSITIDQKGQLSVEFHYGGVGSRGLNICGVELVGNGGETADFHKGFAGSKESANVYSVDVMTPGTYTLRCYVENKTEPIDSQGNIKIALVVPKEGETTGDIVPLLGVWSRNTTLEAGKTWSVGSVVGLMAPEEARRSVLAYVERERAVPWRPFPIYNSWYELNINRTNKNHDCNQNMKVEQTVDVLKQWKTNMFDKQGVSIKAFVWDDGWDKYGTWEFNAGFPNGFTEPDIVARQMCSGQGAWLGPCGGYDTAGDERKAYWTKQGLECNLYNKKYYDVFVGACRRLCMDYDFRYFKFDGISSLGTAYGPNMNATSGEEDAEGIISVERDIRENIKPDIFFNTTVGTWASPAWFNISDAVWRQENDHGLKGNNSNSRERWITYRDELVHRHFVTESPLTPINSMMTHGFMLSNYGGPKDMPMDYNSVLRELRCAFACGSGQVELYADYALLNSINDGALWKDVADLVKWQRANADVLPDIHWVGGNPFDTKENVYGWAAWNGNKAVLSLRNGNASSQKFEFTLREALNIPHSVNTTVTLVKPFDDQKALSGLTEGQPIDIDQKITVTLPGSSVYMFNGTDGNGHLVLVSDLRFADEEMHVAAGRAKAPEYTLAPLDASDKTLEWTSADESIATVNDGAITGVKAGETTVTATTVDGSGLKMTIKVVVDVNLQNDLDVLIDEAQKEYDANEAVEYGENLITKTSQFSSPFSDAAEGKTFPLIDGDGSTFWHSNWHNGDQKPHSHYLQVTIPEAVSGTVQATVMRRLNNGNTLADDNPILMGVEASADGKTFKSVGQMSLPMGDVTVYGSFVLDEAAKVFRFWNDKSNNKDRGYWHVGDFQLNCVVRESANSDHPEAAQALIDALTAARKVKDATQPDIDALQAALDAYRKVLNGDNAGLLSPLSHAASSTSYDLQGRKATGNTHGIVVKNGKKVVE